MGAACGSVKLGRMKSLLRAVLGGVAVAMLTGCAVVTVASTAASLAVTAGSVAVDAAVGAAKITGSAVGAAAGAVLPSP
jgi:hypothetical protein